MTQAASKIPNTITVHLDTPSCHARNITIPFVDYIKNIASCAIYPTWPDSALRANIYAQISFVLNRFSTEYYRRCNHKFDITNCISYDPCFIEGRTYYEPISQIVDEIFNNYLVHSGSVEPLLAQYCNGTTVTCNGLSQWGTVPLSKQGATPYQILTNYYGKDIDIIYNTPLSEKIPSYPGMPLQANSSGNDVHQIQMCLNRISTNYPVIDKIYPESGIFDANTKVSVRQFQDVFNLPADGIVGKATWYKIFFVYHTIKHLSDLQSEGITLSEDSFLCTDVLRSGSTGNSVEILQYFLSILSVYYHQIPSVIINGHFKEKTKQAVIAFQQLFHLIADGIVNLETWNALLQASQTLIENQNMVLFPTGAPLYQGRLLTLGMSGQDVRLVQTYLQEISHTYPEISNLSVTGYFGDQTRASVITFQGIYRLEENGIVGPMTWDTLASAYVEFKDSSRTSEGQYPGYPIGGEL